MPNTKSAKKELRKSVKQKAYNREIKDNVKKLAKQTQKAIIAKDGKAQDLIAQTLKALDKAAQKGVYKKNTVDRKKSRIHALFNKEVDSQKK